MSETCDKLYVDAVGVELVLDTIDIDLASAVDFSIKWQSPSGNRGEWKTPNVTFVDTTKIKRRFETGDLYEASTKTNDWRFMTWAKLSNGFESPGCTFIKHVDELFE